MKRPHKYGGKTGPTPGSFALSKESAARRGLKRRRSLASRFWAQVSPEPTSGCWLWAGSLACDGYGKISVGGSSSRSHRNVPATHIALLIVGRPVSRGMFACHKCDNRACVNPDHLFVGSCRDNVRDALLKGRRLAVGNVGAANPKSKLSAGDIPEIRRLIAERVSAAKIGARFGVHAQSIHQIAWGITWRHV